MLTRQRLDVVINSIMASLGMIDDEWIKKQCLQHHINEETLRELVEHALEERAKVRLDRYRWIALPEEK